MTCVTSTPALFAAAVLLLGSPAAWPQGQVLFNNRVNNLVVAPVYGIEPAMPALAKYGNTAEGFPAGTQVYQGTKLAGPGFTAQLFGGTTRAMPANLQPLIPTVSFRTGDGAGFIVAPDLAVSVNGVATGESARMILRAWENRGGSISNWTQVLADPSIARGESLPFTTPPLGGLFQPPPNLVGLESFNLTTGTVPPTQIKINFQPDSTPVPSGCLADIGSVFGPRGNGFSYGWNVSHTSVARQRNAMNSPDSRYDTFIEMRPDNSTSWEIALPNGVYGVHVTSGDPQSLAGVYRVEAEGVLAVHGTPVTGRNWVAGDAIVEVKDQRLTIRNGAGSFSNRLCFLEIAALPPPVLQALRTGTSAFSLRGEGGGGPLHQVEAAANLRDWVPLGTVRNAGKSPFIFNDPDSSVNAHRFYRTRTLATPPPAVVYSNAFENGVGPEWSSRTNSTAPFGQRFLGPLGAATARLTLTNLPPHNRATVTFELFVIGTWEGNSSTAGPDLWELRMMSGPTLIKTTFRTVAGLTQAYPGSFLSGSFAPRTGARDNNALGYGEDSIYQLSYTFLHSASTLTLDFVGGTTESIADESWGLDNVALSVQQDPYD